MAGRHDFNAEQGATFTRVVLLKETTTGPPIDLTGASARMQVRPSHDSPVILLDLLSTGVSPALVIDGPLGKITIGVTAAAMTALAEGGVYDLEVEYPDATVLRALEGQFNLLPEVTR